MKKHSSLCIPATMDTQTSSKCSYYAADMFFACVPKGGRKGRKIAWGGGERKKDEGRTGDCV